jgi:hypothetical protein
MRGVHKERVHCHNITFEIKIKIGSRFGPVVWTVAWLNVLAQGG